MARPNTDGPFILLDDARAQGASPTRLYRNPVRIIETYLATEVPAALDALANAQKEGFHTAGFLSYEAGQALEPKLKASARASDDPNLPLLWFGIFDRFEAFSIADLPDPAGGWIAAPKPRLTRADYASRFTTIKNYIDAGDIYQANLTFPCDVQTAGDPLALYAGLRDRAKAGYGGVIWTGKDWLLSLSPELFFAMRHGKVTTKPMKGTAARDPDPVLDQRAIDILRTDPKQCAENLMIVDLLRNDLSRVAEAGSVTVPELFHVETYPTLHTMTSTVTAQLRPDMDAAGIITAIYPCGSITGAPKIRSMEVINEVETAPRGAYTGSIGRIDANGDAAFNVAIRTLHLRAGETTATLGLGGGIVADSKLAEEWDECLAKGKFVADPRSFDLIETMRFDPLGGIALLERHMERLKTSADALGFAFDRHATRNELQAATFRIYQSRRVRLMLSRSGKMAIEITPLHPTPVDPVSVAIMPLPVDPSDFRLRHKTSDRAFYTKARSDAGTFEVALIDADGFLTEGSFTNIFVKRDGQLLTPPLSRGLLPGVMRGELIDRAMAVEADLTENCLKDGFFIGNASRGLLPAQLVRL
ncbi:MAG: aminodeoxychorismate synthase component I [Chakrabartia sp.]